MHLCIMIVVVEMYLIHADLNKNKCSIENLIRITNDKKKKKKIDTRKSRHITIMRFLAEMF